MRYLVLITLFLAMPISNATANKLRVVTCDIEPFSFEQDGVQKGFCLELWDSLARELKLEYELSRVGSANDMVEAVKNKNADVAVGGLSITSGREQMVDFSHEYYESGLQIVVSKNAGGLLDSIFCIFQNVFSWNLLAVFSIAILVMFVISYLVWVCEHPVNEEMWPRSYLSGIGESFWWTINIFLCGGADKSPIGLGGRIVATIWMLASVSTISLFTASLSAVLTVNSLSGDINGPNDLPGREVATVGGFISETWLRELNANGGSQVKLTLLPDIPACLDALNRGKVQAIVFDASVLKYYINKLGPEDFEIKGNLFDRNNYGFALQQGSPLREQINCALLKLKESGFIDDLEKKWFGDLN